jgi:hypothetical protein
VDPRERLEEMRRQQGLKSTRRRSRRRPGSMLIGSGNASLYVAVLVVFSGYTIWTTVNTFSRGLYLQAGIGVLISLTMVAMLFWVIRSRRS